jgi:TPR repeat protein
MNAAMTSLGVVIALAVGEALAGEKQLQRKPLARPITDIAELKAKAESGDAKAQVVLAEKFAASRNSAEALIWYRKAALQGDPEGMCQTGRMLLFGAYGSSPEQKVAASPIEGILWTYRAATNFNNLACRNLSLAYQKGVGVKTNSILAYAWLRVHVDRDPKADRSELNLIVLQLTAAQIRQAQSLAQEFKRGRWLPPESQANSGEALGLKLQGILMGKTPTATINGRGLAEGESAKLNLEKGAVVIKCLEIRNDSVLVSVDGQATRLLLIR